MLLDEFISRAIEIPFKEKGRGWDGTDCWGLVVLAFKEVRNIQLPNHENDYVSTKRLKELRYAIKKFSGNWVEINTPQPMDCILLCILGMPTHIGLIIDTNGNFIHTESKRNASVDNVNKIAWRGDGYNNIEGVYRYVGQ